MRRQIVECARGWLSTPWRHQARLKGIGVDCVGFIAEVGRECGILSVQEAANYKRRPDGVTLRAKLDEYLTPVRLADIQPADVLLFSTSGKPDHVGLVGDYPAAGELSVIHAYLPARKVIEHRLDPTWRGKVVAAYAIPGIA